MRLKFKTVKGSYQADALCCNGYTFTFYIQHQPPPDNYIKQGYSPLHVCVMFMFDQLQLPHHNVYMDNLYMSDLFCKRAQNSKNKVNTHGVCRGELKDIQKFILQTEVQNEKLQFKLRGTVKSCCLGG